MEMVVADDAPAEPAWCACKCLMKVMYFARFARFDLLRAVGGMATMITKWTPTAIAS